MATKNEHTGDSIISRPNSEAYRNSPLWDNLEKKKNEQSKKTANTSDSVQSK